MAKITGKEGLRFEGDALCFDCEEDMVELVGRDPSAFRGKVVVIRYEGPKGGPGMPEMLTPTSAIMGAGLGKECALITDGRFSGGSHGFVIGHVTPEAQEGGPIGLLKARACVHVGPHAGQGWVAVTCQSQRVWLGRMWMYPLMRRDTRCLYMRGEWSCRLTTPHTCVCVSLQDGDRIVIDVERRVMDVVGLPTGEWERRKAAFKAPVRSGWVCVEGWRRCVEWWKG